MDRLVKDENYPVGDNSCDLVAAFLAAHWFNLPAFYEEVRRILAPGGTVALVAHSLPVLEFPWAPELTKTITACYQKVHISLLLLST
jgi:SAM-dependent methyltransferase